jgi:predicted transcriptional regulator of viral defense system
MQTLTALLLDQGLQNHILTDDQMARLIEGSAQRRYSLVNRAIKAGELLRVRRGLYLLPRRYRGYDCHPFALAQMIAPGSYISLETALNHYGWIPEAVYSTACIVPGAKSSEFENAAMGRFSFHPLAYASGYFLELVAREIINQQAVLVARPVRALMDLVCLRKEEWQGFAWFEKGLRIEAESLRAITGDQLRTLKLVYKHTRMQRYLGEMEKALGLEPGSADR